ncbi:MAG: transcriptional regulator [Flavobacteriaceae bacterium]|jgi:HTH-type transcriptional regulator/antitoxin HigA|nr:transcriptional regulator [Flavobacteriaceae bacterium]
MNWRTLKTEKDYNKANKRLMEIFHAEPDTPEDDELGVLILLIKDYDEKHYALPEISALEAIKYRMQEWGLKNKDLEPIIGSKSHVSSILSGRRELTLKTAKRLKEYFKLPAEVFLRV